MQRYAGERKEQEIFYKLKIKRSRCSFLGQLTLNRQQHGATVVLGPVEAQRCGRASTDCDRTLGTHFELYRHRSRRQHIKLPFLLIRSI